MLHPLWFQLVVGYRYKWLSQRSDDTLMMHSYKLEYFPSRFRAEAIRLILHYKSQDFKDVRLNMMTQWPKRKPSTPFGGLPVLTVDGIQLSQSIPICQFLARKFNLAGKDEIEIAHVNAIADFQNDLMNATVPYIIAVMTNAEDLVG